MFCPSCGKENANNSGYCNFCGRALTPPPGATTGPGVAPAPATYSSPAYAPLSPPSAPKSRAPIAVVIVVLFLAAAAGGFFYMRNADTETAEARIGRLTREASGAQPVKTGFMYSMSKWKKFDDVFREQYRNLFHINQDYIAAVKKADISAVSVLGTPGSFADPSTAAEALKQLHAVYQLDMGQEEKVREVVAAIRHIIETSDWAAGDREGAMKGFDEGLAVPLSKRQAAVGGERAWVESIDDVYNYATQNHSVFVLQEGQLLVNDGQVLEEFNSRVRTMNSRRTEFLQAKQDYDTYQQQLFQKMGVDPKDMGIQ